MDNQQVNQTPQETPALEATAAAAAPVPAATTPPPVPEGTLYTDAQLQALKATWLTEQQAAQSAEQDFEKMTPEQQAQKQLEDQKTETARLQAELKARDLADYARCEISKAQLPPEALAFVTGSDNAEIDTKIKVFAALLATGVQAGVNQRFQQNGYTPRGSAVSDTGADCKKRSRGVTFNEKK